MSYSAESIKSGGILNNGFILLLLCKYVSLQYALETSTKFDTAGSKNYEEKNSITSFVNDSQVGNYEYTRKFIEKPTTKSIYDVVTTLPDPSQKNSHCQGSTVTIGIDGNVVLLHRGNRIQTERFDFDSQNRYRFKHLGPIPINTVVIIHPVTTKILQAWGKNVFYFPHGITVAPNGDIFITDLAMHQVFRFPPGTHTPSLTLGEPFVPGNDESNFCKPAAVAVMSSGDFFVADGYCNSRIIKFDSQGNILLTWGRSYQKNLADKVLGKSPPTSTFAIPHALALAEDKDLLFVADRLNGRIQCFSASGGKFKYVIESHEFGERVFGVAYSPIKGGTIFVLNEKSSKKKDERKLQGFVIPLSSKKITSVFSPNGQGFNSSHGIAVTKDGEHVYVVENSIPYILWKFERSTKPSP